jgi:hypothetical protein
MIGVMQSKYRLLQLKENMLLGIANRADTADDHILCGDAAACIGYGTLFDVYFRKLFNRPTQRRYRKADTAY